MTVHLGKRRILRARYLLPLAAIALAAVLLLAWPRGLQTPKFQQPSADRSTPSQAVQRLRAGAAGANLIIILLDAARASHFTSFGHDRNTTPNIAKLFDDGILLTEAYAAGANTKASVASLFTSQFPDTHGTLSLPWPLATEDATLAECLRDAGYTTAGFIANPVVSREFGYARGFDTFDEVARRSPDRLHPGVVDGAKVRDAAIGWMRAHKGKRFFTYLHFLEPHYPYAAPGAFRKRIMGGEERDWRRADQSIRYDASLAYADSLVGNLLSELKKLGLFEKSVIIVLADHGEAFGEHGYFGHTTTVYREMVHIPVGVQLPSRCESAPRRRSEVFCLTDLMPTLLDLLGVPPSKTMQGRARLALLTGEDESLPGFAVTRARGGDATGGQEDSNQVSYALRVPRYTLILGDRGRQVELYDRSADPGEQENLASKQRDVTRDLHARFRAWAATQRGRPVVLRGGRVFLATSQDPEMTERTRQELKTLGYLK